MNNHDAGLPVGGSAFHKNDITYSTSVATPHIKWAAKLPGGPINGFFIPSVEFGRDMAELMQRLNLEPTTVSIDRSWDINCWGIGDYYGHEERGDRDDFRVVFGYVERDLTGPADFEVLVIPGLNGWTRLTRPARDAILRRVAEGAGLVLIHPFLGDVENHPFAGDEATGDARLWEISPLVDCPNDTVSERGYPEINKEAIAEGIWETAQSHFITDGVPLALLPEGTLGSSFYKYRATGEVLIQSGEHPIVAVKEYGKGRVVALGYVEQGFLPTAVDAVKTPVPWDYWEYQYLLLCRAIVWAARRESDVRIASFTAEPTAISFVVHAPDAEAVDIAIFGKTAFGQSLRTYQKRLDLVPGTYSVTIPITDLQPASGWPQGKLIFDLIMRDTSGATLDWSSATFDSSRQATLTAITPAAALHKREDTLQVTVRLEGDTSGLQVRFTATDDYDRVLTAQESPATEQVSFSYRLGNFLGKFATLRAELMDAQGFVIDRIETKPLLIAPTERRVREYTASIGFRTLRPYFRSPRLRQIRAASTDIGMTWTEGVNNDLDIPRGSFGIYWYDRGPFDESGIEKAIAEYQRAGDYDALPYNAKRVLYQRTLDKKLLVRIPSFCDPDFMGKLRESVRKSAEEKAAYGLDYYFVGDEGSLTSYGDAYDFSWDEHTLVAFREWLKAEYGSLEALNTEWKSDFSDWESVVPFTTEEAQQANNYAPWADHRTFMEVVFADAYQMVRDAVIQGDPDGHIAVSGTQATAPYNGCDWYRLDQVIDDFLSYDVGSQWELHRSFAKPGSMIGFWTGYGSSGLAVQHAIWNAAIHNVLYPQIFWLPAFLNPDFTHSKSAHDMGAAFHALRHEGIGKLLMESERLHDGIAIHYSMPSVHASVPLLGIKKAEDEQSHFNANLAGWVTVITDLGLQTDFVAYSQVEAGALDSGKYRVFILPFSAALSSEEVQAIERFAQSGGIVIADAAAGVMDDHCAWREDSSLNDFFGIETVPSAQRTFTQIAGPVSVTDAGRAWGLSSALTGDLPFVEAIKAATSIPLITVGEHDAVCARPVGQGWAIYLNIAVGSYNRSRRSDSGTYYREIMNRLLRHLDIRPTVEVLDVNGEPVTQAQVAHYRFGNSEVLAIVTAPMGGEAFQDRDGVTSYQDTNLGPVATQELTIRLPHPFLVTDARTGKRLGMSDTVKTTVTVGGSLVLGLSQTENPLSLSGPDSARPGDHMEFRITAAQSEKTLVRCHVFSPNGCFLPYYAKNLLLVEKEATFIFPSAVNDAPGTYTICVTDIITGDTAEAMFLLQ